MLNQLLTEMDGFEGNTGIIVVAATNRADVLDPALLRPGRFDRQVSVDVPDSKGRLEILKVHAKNKRVNPEISLAEIAKRVPGFSGADLANLMNEAAILCGRRNKDSITALEIDDSIDRIVAGMEGTKLTDGKVKSLVAYHEGALGGRAAEVVVFGEDEVTTGASGDLQQVSNMAKQMVTNYGMSEIGPWSLQDEGAQSQDMIMRMMSR